MTRGRKPLPQEIKRLRDTDQPCRERPSSVIGEPVRLEEIGSKCQVSGLKSSTPRARDIYWATCRKVAAQGMLDPTFCSQILFYAIEYDIVLRCEEDIKKKGMYVEVEGKFGTMLVQNPSVKQLHAAMEKVLKIGSNFGFSPVDRQRLKMEAGESKPKGFKAIFAMVSVDEEGPEDQ